MSRRLRFLPEEGTLVEVTCRTVHGRYLLLPSPLRDEILIGALARALAKYGARCISFAFMSSHYHLLLEVDSALQLARTMNYFNSKLAKEIGRLTGFDRTLEYAARRRGEKFDRLKYSTPETLTLEPLPCWRHLEPERRKRLIAALVKEIEDEAAAARKRNGIQVAGVDAVLAHHPHDRPEKLKKGPAPLFHAATKEMRQFLWSLYAEFVGRFRDAAEKLRAGFEATFPPGSFPPALPYVPG